MAHTHASHIIPGCERFFKNCRCEPARYFLVFLFSLAIFAVQVKGGEISGSAALYADSAHVALDGVSALISMYVAIAASSLTKQAARERRVKWMRISAFVLLVGLAWLGWEAFDRLRYPQSVEPMPLILIATFGILMNLLQHQVVAHEHTATGRIQRLHVLTDMFSSAMVIVGGLLVWITGEKVFDSLFTFLVIAIVFESAYSALLGEDSQHDHSSHA